MGIQLGETHRAKILNKGRRSEDDTPYVVVEIEEGVPVTISVDIRTFNNLPNIGQYIFVRDSGRDIQTGYEVVLNVPEGMKDPNSFFANTQYPIILIIYSILGLMSNIISAVAGIVLAIAIMRTHSKEGLQLLVTISVIAILGMIMGWIFYWFMDNLFITAITGILFAFGWIVFFVGFVQLYKIGKMIKK